MRRSERKDTGDTLIGMKSLGSLQVECYIRSNLSRVSERQVEVLLERLRALRDAGRITDFETHQWPPKRHAVVESQAAAMTRSELFAKFESWATQRGYSLAPAFERRTSHPSLLGNEEPREEIRVPIVTLALYDSATENAPLTGVVPYTENPGTSQKQTYTIDTWLSALEEETTGATDSAVHLSSSVQSGQ